MNEQYSHLKEKILVSRNYYIINDVEVSICGDGNCDCEGYSYPDCVHCKNTDDFICCESEAYLYDDKLPIPFRDTDEFIYFVNRFSYNKN